MTWEDVIREELETTRSEIIQRSEAAGQKASGQTYAQILVKDVSNTGGKIVGPRYSGVLAFGRRSGKVPYNMPQIIKEWAKYKGISFDTEENFNRWAEAVSWKIRREGTQLWRTRGSVGQELDIFTTPINDFTRRIAQRFSNLITAEILDQIKRPKI